MSSHFTLRQEGEATLIDITPARPDTAFLAAAVLLGGLFGLPALAILLNPARHDALSLSAAAIALAVVALAGLALRRALAGRRRRSLRLDPQGLTLEGATHPWATLGTPVVDQPKEMGATPASGIHGLAAGIAARQRASQARVLFSRRNGAPPLPVAAGLRAETAEALRHALASAAARHAQ